MLAPHPSTMHALAVMPWGPRCAGLVYRIADALTTRGLLTDECGRYRPGHGARDRKDKSGFHSDDLEKWLGIMQWPMGALLLCCFFCCLGAAVR
jgi:hypothetical protein